MSEKQQKHWIIRIVPAIAFAAGIIMASIGGIITLQAGAKLALFDHGPYNRITREQCQYDYNNYDYDLNPLIYKDKEKMVNTQARKRTEAEIQKCLTEKNAAEKERFQEDKKQNLVDGISALIVGFILIFAFKKRE